MIPLLTGLLVTVLLAPAVRSAMLRVGVVDRPNARSSHTLVTPRGGGLAVWAGTAAVGVLAVVSDWSIRWGLVAAAWALCLLGFIDDRRGLHPLTRLLGQALLGAVAGASIGGVLPAVAGAVGIPVIVNVVNFMDGINGISVGQAVVWGGTLLLAGGLDGPLTTLAVMAAGPFLGFLPWNAPRARMFLGDSGSYLLGGLVGVGILQSLSVVGQPPWWVVSAPMALYLADTTSTLVRRLVSGKPLLQAHREHVYQQLSNEAGLPHWIVALWVTGGSALIAWLWWQTHPAVAGVLTLALVAAYLSSPAWVSRVRPTSDRAAT